MKGEVQREIDKTKPGFSKKHERAQSERVNTEQNQNNVVIRVTPRHRRNRGFNLNKLNLNMSGEDYRKMVKRYKSCGIG